jgi:hypothetical protein
MKPNNRFFSFKNQNSLKMSKKRGLWKSKSHKLAKSVPEKYGFLNSTVPWGRKNSTIWGPPVFPNLPHWATGLHCTHIPVMRTRFFLCTFSHWKNPVMKTGFPCVGKVVHRENPVLALYWPCTGLQCCDIFMELHPILWI